MGTLTALERVRDFGVFDDYARPHDLECLAELNLIYGWNYSGKTTLSRILRSIELRSVHPGYQSAQFEVSTDSGVNITESSLDVANEKVRVFNSDFVDDNLSWDGDSFEPILLLGQESIEAQKELQKNDLLLERLRNVDRETNAEIERRNAALRDKKTAKARSIKQTLQIVEAYTATHLNQDLASIEGDPNEHIVQSTTFTELIQAATVDEKDKLPKLQKLTVGEFTADPAAEVKELLSQTPALTSTIQHLADHPEIAQWVRSGLPLHDGKKDCEFCGNDISPSRIESLQAHFSKDIELLELALTKSKEEIERLKLSSSELHINDFYPQYRDALNEALMEMNTAEASYNSSLESLITAVDTKLASPFEVIACPTFDSNSAQSVTTALEKINGIIEQNNIITDSFEEQKTEAIDTLKLHFAAEFHVEERISAWNAELGILRRHLSWYQAAVGRIKLRNDELKARISQAQKGREELNGFIEMFLVGSNVSVDVVSVDGVERFRLLRGTEPATHLSEGERTAIAFAFFLIKLKEHTDLSELIVYIDDPVSSLDSNHIFQIFSATRSFFFRQDSSDGDKWKLTVAQLFISTHNFEFLGLSKELPIRKARRKYYFVKRLNVGRSTFMAMPPSIIKYSSEYQYLWSVIHDFHMSPDKSDLEQLLSLPNALRRFVELYTYSKCPSDDTVDRRADIVFGAEKARRILKLLHHFSHSNNLIAISQNNDLICDIENVVDELIGLVKEDQRHFKALMSALA